MSFANDLRVAFRSLTRTKGLVLTVVLTLALGIGANAAIFTLVRGVLLKPLVNRDEDRLIYIRQSAPGVGDTNATFSVPPGARSALAGGGSRTSRKRWCARRDSRARPLAQQANGRGTGGPCAP